MRVRMVWKLVRVPPSQRWLTYHIPQRSASLWMTSWACRFVPTNSTLPPPGDQLHHVLVGIIDHAQGLLQVNDVDAVALGKDVALHGGVPPAGLVPKMHSRLQQRLHVDGFAARGLRRPFRRGPGRPFLGCRCGLRRALGHRHRRFRCRRRRFSHGRRFRRRLRRGRGCLRRRAFRYFLYGLSLGFNHPIPLLSLTGYARDRRPDLGPPCQKSHYKPTKV